MNTTIIFTALLLLAAIFIISLYLLKLSKFDLKGYKEYSKICKTIIYGISAIVGALGVGTMIVLNINDNIEVGSKDNSSNRGTIVSEAIINGNGNILGNNNNVTNTFIYNNDLQRDQLLEGKICFDNKDYETAFKIYNSEELKYNDYARINTAYLYAHGLGVEENIFKAMEIYDEVDTDEARRNKLGLLIASNDQGSNNEQILELIDYFIAKDDYYVWDFLSFSKFGKGINEMLQEDTSFKQSFSYCLSDLYIWESERGKYTNPPRNTAYVWYIFVGADFDYNTYKAQSLPYFYYDVYQLKYLKCIDKIWG